MTKAAKKTATKPLKQMRLFVLPLPAVTAHEVTVKKAPANLAWQKVAYLVVAQIAKSGIKFTTDLVWAKLGKNRPNEPRALGPVMTMAEKDGIVCRVNGAAPSTMQACHGRHKRLWVGVGT